MHDVILLEDEPVLRQELSEFLDAQGYAPACASSLAEFMRLFDASRHRLAVIDIGLPDGSGLQLIRWLRSQGLTLGLVVFSARGSTAERVAGLDGGADHYLSKSCDFDELAATLAALSRRIEAQQEQACWLLELGPRRLHVPQGGVVALSQQDVLVLQCLMLNAGSSVSRRQIVQALGADFFEYDQRRLDTQMLRLRRRVLAAGGRPLPVSTRRNQGYCFSQRAQVQA